VDVSRACSEGGAHPQPSNTTTGDGTQHHIVQCSSTSSPPLFIFRLPSATSPLSPVVAPNIPHYLGQPSLSAHHELSRKFDAAAAAVFRRTTLVFLPHSETSRTPFPSFRPFPRPTVFANFQARSRVNRLTRILAGPHAPLQQFLPRPFSSQLPHPPLIPPSSHPQSAQQLQQPNKLLLRGGLARLAAMTGRFVCVWRGN
jgi:hypothetical protein